MELDKNRTRDVLVMGRANVDLYARDPNTSLMDASIFEKSVGGCAANIAVGLARLGRRVDFLGRVSDDPFGRFVHKFLDDNKVATDFLTKDDSGSLTSVAFAERRPVDSQVLFYRNGASDITVDIPHVDAVDFEKFAAFVVTGTGLSLSPSREATLYAMEKARHQGTKVILDLDWRPSSWLSRKTAGLFYRLASGLADIIIGTKEEYAVILSDSFAKENLPDQEIAKRILSGKPEFVVVKNGAQGAKAFGEKGGVWETGVFPVTVKKNYGAGDAFAAALIHGLLESVPKEEAMRLGSAAAALVISDAACAAASPDLPKLQGFLQEQEERGKNQKG